MNTPNTTIEDVLKKHDLDFNYMTPAFKRDIIAAMTEYASLNRQGWTRVDSGLPEDNESVWFYCPKYNAVGAGKFYKQDNFKRENIFISNDGGHYLLEDVSHYMINKKPLPPE